MNWFSLFCGFSLFTFLMNILCIGLVSQLVLCAEDVVAGCTSSTVPLSYAYVMLSLSSIVILAVTCLSGYLYFNAQLDYGEIIEQSLTKFKSEDQIRDALKSSDQAQKRAGTIITISNFWVIDFSCFRDFHARSRRRGWKVQDFGERITSATQ